MFQQFAVMDIGTGSVPANYLACLISNGHRAGAKPAILTGLTADAVLKFVIFTGQSAARPMRRTWLPVFRMHVVQPAETISGTCWRSGVFMKPPADIISGSIRFPAEDDGGSRFHA